MFTSIKEIKSYIHKAYNVKKNRHVHRERGGQWTRKSQKARIIELCVYITKKNEYVGK